MELFPLHPTREQRKQLVDNILSVWDSATPEERVSGMTWYTHAHQLAETVGHGDVSKGAGIIAALSANTGWGRNQKLALAQSAGQEIHHMGSALTKVDAITKGANVIATLGKGPKTINFYFNIRDPESPTPVTVDRHAHDVARGEAWGGEDRGLGVSARYQVFAEAYRDAAALRDVLPNQMQAVTWEVWRNRKK